ncbi:hypothetical protein GCM10007071_05160 [Marinobacter zhanjiangensis]|uniref:Uncharacterized protein n=1 Tax=Marinobacter zhanjiangensis TaxID=578215 RepID=A0ABQ3AML1_9GAMM|nr:hypothetical protein GCM10007071_05160 [Marinobacter zhanjiangensis]
MLGIDEIRVFREQLPKLFGHRITSCVNRTLKLPEPMIIKAGNQHTTKLKISDMEVDVLRQRACFHIDIPLSTFA